MRRGLCRREKIEHNSPHICVRWRATKVGLICFPSKCRWCLLSRNECFCRLKMKKVNWIGWNQPKKHRKCDQSRFEHLPMKKLHGSFRSWFGKDTWFVVMVLLLLATYTFNIFIFCTKNAGLVYYFVFFFSSFWRSSFDWVASITFPLIDPFLSSHSFAQDSSERTTSVSRTRRYNNFPKNNDPYISLAVNEMKSFDCRSRLQIGCYRSAVKA